MENPFQIGKEISLEKRIEIIKSVEQDSIFAEKRAGEIINYFKSEMKYKYHSNF